MEQWTTHVIEKPIVNAVNYASCVLYDVVTRKSSRQLAVVPMT